MEKVDLSGDIEVPKEIHVSSAKKGFMAIQLSNINLRGWFQKRRESVQPWGEFVSTSKFKVPKSLAPVGKRLVKNIDRFQSNYLFIFLGLVGFCILTSPMLLIAIAASLGACYIISLKNQDQKFSIAGRELSLAQQYSAVGLLSFPLFWVAGAGSVVFWIIGASVFIILLHASMYTAEEEVAELTEIQMEAV